MVYIPFKLRSGDVDTANDILFPFAATTAEPSILNTSHLYVTFLPALLPSGSNELAPESLRVSAIDIVCTPVIAATMEILLLLLIDIVCTPVIAATMEIL